MTTGVIRSTLYALTVVQMSSSEVMVKADVQGIQIIFVESSLLYELVP